MQNVCLQELLALWLEACAAKGASAKTLKTYHTQTEPFVRFLLQQGCQTPEDVTPQHVRRYLLFWRERGVSSETLWNYYRNPR
ncbi:MAG: phage integrase N-terminal SAM-like domain-containing protein, partial [Candidatus Bipolaricaulota bacterium]|nr:phage integrase N-terminal SAM-like domain-containing protein [Candidatus Bipolaricaulota bacterium]